MAKIIFYRQKRRDGGIRTGVEINGNTELGLEEGFEGDELDPVLVWWIELRCEAKTLPTDPEEARQWLLEQTPVIRSGFEALAREVRTGIDFNTYPYLWPVPKAPRGVRITVACFAMRRVDGREMADVLADVAAHWRDRIKSLPATEPV